MSPRGQRDPVGEEWLDPRHPVDAAGKRMSQVALSIVQLHDQVDRQGTQGTDQLVAERVQRGFRRSRRRIKHGGKRRIQAEGMEDRLALNGPVDHAIGLGHADQLDRRTVGADGAARDEVGEAALVDEEKAVPRPHRLGRGVEAAFARHAVKHLDPQVPRSSRGNVKYDVT